MVSVAAVASRIRTFYEAGAMGEGWTANPVLTRQADMLHGIHNGPTVQRVLDLGCGGGANTQMLFPHRDRVEVVGLDISHRATLAYVSANHAPAVVAAADALPFADGSFDLVVSDDVIEHLVDTDTYAKEIRRVLGPDGLLALSTPNLAAWFNRLALAAGVQPAFSEVSFERVFGRPGNELVGHLRLFTKKAIVQFLQYHGFEIVKVRGAPFNALPLGVRWLDSLLARLPSLAGVTIVLARVA